MKQEDKELLLKDLCSRLPYGVEVEYNKCKCELLSIDKDNEELTIWKFYGYHPDVKLEDIKPYLFPLSSITEEQRNEYHELLYNPEHGILIDYFDWCHKNHLDCRGLIEKGLAIDATNLNIY